MSLSPEERAVIAALRQNCRVKHTTLAREQGWPVSTAHERVHRCCKRHVKHHTCLLDFKTLGFNERTIWIVKPQHREAWLAGAVKLTQINTLCRSHSGEFLVESICRDAADEQRFRRQIGDGALVVSSHPVLDVLKAEAAFATADGFTAAELRSERPSD
jgi:DNA-binding Lrp family transcriptional regulator